jgi:hypothetical protein
MLAAGMIVTWAADIAERFYLARNGRSGRRLTADAAPRAAADLMNKLVPTVLRGH